MSGPLKIIRTDSELECPGIDRALRDMGADLVLLSETVSEDRLVREATNADLILMCYTPVTERVIEGAVRLKGIVKYGVGIDAIDIEAANARQIPVVNIPEYAEETVAEGAFALLIALAKKLLPIHAAMQSDGWAWPTARWLGSDISGRTLGLVGVGRIGERMARMAGAGFGARVLGYDPHRSEEEMRSAGVEKQDDLCAMLERCDFVSVHCVLNDRTRHLIGARELQCMKPSAFVVNVSRGAIVDETALLRALTEKAIAGAGLDVFSSEPLSRSHDLSPLYAMDNVILTPHLAFYTREAMQRLEQETLERCREILAGEPAVVKSHDPRLRSQHGHVRFEG